MQLLSHMRPRLSSLVKPVRAVAQNVCARVVRSPYQCPVCDARLLGFITFDRFVPHLAAELRAADFDLQAADFETLHTSAYGCPICRCSDRDRMCYLYIFRALESAGGRAAFLDIAPAGLLATKLRACGRFEYRSADFAMPDVDDVGLDLQDMSRYRDAQFDRFLCSHVLEHVPDDRRAMSELYRVLKPGGWGIAMVPISLSLAKTLEDPAIVDSTERTRAFGQSDHVRLYSKQDFVTRLEQAGFVVDEVSASALTPGAPADYGIDPRSVLYVCHKR